MSQQEFESQRDLSGQLDEEIDRPHYPYAWSEEAQKRGMPRDEPPVNAGNRWERSRTRPRNASRTPQVPSWARPQPRQGRRMTPLFTLFLLVMLLVVLGSFGALGAVLGVLLHILGILIGAFFVLLLVLFLIVFLIIALIRRAMSRAFRPPWLRS